MKVKRKVAPHPYQPTPENYCDLGKQMNADMQMLGITQADLSRHFDRDRTLFSHIMRGDFPTSPWIPKILEYLEEQKRGVKNE